MLSSVLLRVLCVPLLLAALACAPGCHGLHQMSTGVADTAEGTHWNLSIPTFGGKQFWADEICEGGWHVQRNVLTGHYRLLDPDEVRRAWGSFEGCRQVLDEARQEGRVVTAASGHLVVLLPGIIRSKDAFPALEHALSRSGYRVAAVNYPSAMAPLENHARQIDTILNHTHGVTQVSFVTHSLGGLVVRQLLGREPDPADTDDWRNRTEVHSVVMLFPPNQGAHLANRMHDEWWYRTVLGPSGQQLTTRHAARLPVPDCPVAVVAGGSGAGGRNFLIPGDDDGTVAVAETHLPEADHKVINVGHTFGMNDPRVIETTLAFLRDRSL